MANHKRRITRQRLFMMSLAVKDIYDSFNEKGRDSRELGLTPSRFNSWIKGIRPVPPTVLSQLYELSKDRRLLMTQREREDFLRHAGSNFNLPEISELPILRDEELSELLSNLPPVPEDFGESSKKPTPTKKSNAPPEPTNDGSEMARLARLVDKLQHVVNEIKWVADLEPGRVRSTARSQLRGPMVEVVILRLKLDLNPRDPNLQSLIAHLDDGLRLTQEVE